MISLYHFFTINSDFDRPERKGHRAKWPGNERAMERVGQGVNRPDWPDSLWEANWPGSEKAQYRFAYGLTDATATPTSLASLNSIIV